MYRRPPGGDKHMVVNPVGHTYQVVGREHRQPIKEDPSFLVLIFELYLALLHIIVPPIALQSPRAHNNNCLAAPSHTTTHHNRHSRPEQKNVLRTIRRHAACTRTAAAVAFDQRPTHEATRVSGREKEERNKVQSTHNCEESVKKDH
jgi:hypothetical protein